MPIFTNSTGITFVDNTTITQTVAVGGFASPITRISVSFTGLTHTFPDDLDFLLVGPDGTHNLLFWSDVGSIHDITSGAFTVADSGAAPLPGSAQLVSGTTYQPGDPEEFEFDADFGSATGGINHATSNGTATFASAFNGIDPNGTWTLYAKDDATGDTGSLASWTLNIVTANDLEFDGTAGSDTLVVTAIGANSGSYVLNGAGAVAFSGITSLSFNGLGGDDVLTIVNPTDGLLAIPILYDGGGQSGDALEILGGSAGATTYTATGASSGTIVGATTEVQHVTVSGASGSFTLTFNGQTTASLAFNASASIIQNALNGLSSIAGAGGSVQVAFSGGGNFDITFGGSLANVNVPQLTAGIGGATIVGINTVAQGGRTQAIDFTGLAPVTDTVTDATFTVLGTAGADTITITDGGIVGGDQTWLISSPTFESVRVANKSLLIIDGNGGGDTVSMDTSVQLTGLLNMQIRGVASVSGTGAFTHIQGLTIDATDAVTLTNANDLDTFSAHVTALGGAVQFRADSDFNVNGITTNGGAVTLAADTGDISVGTFAANSGIDTGATGNSVLLQATSGDIIQFSDGAIHADFIGAFAAGFANLAAATNDADFIAIAANGSVNYRDVGGVLIAAIAAQGLFTSTVSGVSSNNNDINLQVGGQLQLNLGGPPAIDAGTGDVRIVAGGAVNQADPGDRILADELGIIAGGPVLLAGDNEVNKLAVSSAGLVEFRDTTGNLAIGQVTSSGSAGFTGASGITSGNNDVNLRTQDSLILDNDINAGTGDIRLVTVGADLTENAGRLIGDAVGILALGGVSATNNNDANTLAISSFGTVTYHDADDLVIGTVAAGGNAGFAGAAGAIGFSISITTSSQLTVASNVAASGANAFLRAGDSAAAGDDLTINGGVTVQAGQNIVLHAGDNLNLLAGSSLVASGFVQGVVDVGNADAGTGGTLNPNGSIATPGGRQFLGFEDGDTLFSAAGFDVLGGLAGNDRFVWDPGDGSDTIFGDADTDTLVFNGSAGDEVFALKPSGVNAIFTRNVGAITMTMRTVEQVELAAGNGANLFSVADMSATDLTGLIAYTGGSGSDTIGAAAAVNPFDVSTGAGNDQVAAGSAADRLRGGAGDDLLIGGLGDDTAVYAGNVGDCQIAFLPGNDIRITDLRSGAPEGADTLRGIENAEFANATLSFLFGTAGDDDFVASGNQAIVAGLGRDTITFDFRLVDATVTYAGHSVLIESGATHTVVSGFDTYVFTDGTVQNNDADVLVDDLFYYARNHDVWTAQAEADQHYHQFGRPEGRDPNAFFSTTIYLAANADVKAAGVDPLIHFDQAGWQEGRVPSLAFDARQYLDANPDVAAARVDPLAHFLAFGAQERRLPFAPTELVSANGFDFVFYLQHNPDVAAANVDPFWHFQTSGWLEGRNPNALFDTSGYLAAYADVAAAHVNPLDHYNAFGRFEGRDPSVGFDTTSYLAANPDVAAAGVNPLVHFLQFGIHEGRSPFADGIFG